MINGQNCANLQANIRELVIIFIYKNNKWLLQMLKTDARLVVHYLDNKDCKLKNKKLIISIRKSIS